MEIIYQLLYCLYKIHAQRKVVNIEFFNELIKLVCIEIRILSSYVTPMDCVRHHSVRKWKDIMRFEIRYFFSLGLTHSQEKSILISNLIICFRFPRASVRHYSTVRAAVCQRASTTTPENNFLFSGLFRKITFYFPEYSGK